MNRILWLLCCIFSTFLVTKSFGAVDTNYVEFEDISPRLLGKGYNAGLIYSHFYYAEPGVMTDRGDFTGVSGSYTSGLFGATRSFVFMAEGDYVTGSTSYDGGKTNIQTHETIPFQTTGADSIANLRVLVGMPSLKNQTLLVPYAGLGLRWLRDKNEGEGSYLREVNYVYLPIGLDFKRQLNSSWIFAGRLEYDFFISGTAIAHNEDFSEDGHPLEFHQSSGYGLRLSTQVTHDFSQNFSLCLKPYYQYWSIQQSTAVLWKEADGYFIEPQNVSQTYGLDLSAKILL